MSRAPAPPRLAVIIPARNAGQHLERCLSALRAQDPEEPLELIVVDNGSTDATSAIARGWRARVVEGGGMKVGAVRNAGARATTAPILAFIDADNEVTGAWVRACVAAFDDPTVAAAGALCSAPAPGTWVQRVYDALRSRSTTRHDVEWLGTGNLAVRRSVFDEVGGFDERLETCEDVDLCRAIRAAGHRIVNEPGMGNVHHGDPRTLKALFLSELWRGRDNLRVALRGGWSARSVPGIVFPILNLGFLAAAAAGLLLAPLGHAWPLLVGAGGFLALVLARWVAILLRSSHLPVTLRAAAFAIAGTFEAARAMSLLTSVDHQVRHKAR